MNDLENKLTGMQFDFDSDFANRVMDRAHAPRILWPSPYWLFGALAASLFLCIGYIYFQEGTLNIDTILGVEQLLIEDTEEIYSFL